MSLLSALFGPYLNTKLNAGDGRTVSMVERPGLWITDTELQTLSGDLRTIASKTLPSSELTYGVFSGDREVFSRTIITLVKDADGKPIAFNALAVMNLDLGQGEDKVLHLGLVMVDPNERSKGLSWVLYGLTCVLLFLRGGFRPLWISNVTQVPAIVGMVSETFSDVFPCPRGLQRRTLRHLLLARGIMRSHRHVFGVGEEARFRERDFVIEDAYTGGSDALKKTFEQAAKHREDIHNDYCLHVLDYERGDDVLQLGKMDISALSQYLFRTVPRQSLMGVLAAGGFLMLQRAILPALQWFNTKQSFGDLRPRT